MEPLRARSGEDATSRQYLTFLLAGEEYAVDILRVREIRGWEGATPIPRTPAHIKGMINLRGAIVPIIDLRERFALPYGEYGPTTVVIVLQVRGADRERTMGIVVDAVSEVHDVPTHEHRPAPDLGSAIDASFIRGLATVGDQMIIILDIDQLLAGPDRQSGGIDQPDTGDES